MATPRLRPRKLSEPTISRLPVYQRIVEGWQQRGETSIDSRQISELAGVTATTVRRDLAGLGTLGTRGSGYEVDVLVERIGEALGHDRSYEVIVVGMGNLGRALVNSTNFLIRGAHLAALYDSDPLIVGTEIAGYVVRSIDDEMVKASVAVICVPPEAAQEVADRLVAADVHALLNFAPQVLNVPLGTAVHYVDFSIELQILMYHLNNGTGPLGGGLLHSLGIAATNPLRTP
ncbi:MAG: redox-sensing transcriptional repressor Rex [Actinomycetota bacterium]|jgi:redox-sensing transcriptional repressor|nr:redox-sensing transcriptional repressor Rex [Actinomycetota bacterium]